MRGLIAHILGQRLTRYVGASVIALLSDLSLFQLLLHLGVMPASAAAGGYCMGIWVHWLVSSRKVFNDGLALRGIGRIRQKALFVGSALLGLALTTVIVGAGDLAGLDPRAAKLVAIVASFALTWILRNRIVFRTDAEV